MLCKPGVNLEDYGDSFTSAERVKITRACAKAATVWFISWMAPFIAMGCNFIVALFCLMVCSLRTTKDASKLQKSLKRFFFVIVSMITGMYCSVYAAGGLVVFGSTFMAFCSAVIVAMVIWLYLEVPAKVLVHIAKGSKLTEYLVKAYRSNVVRAMAVIMINVSIPLYVMLDMARKKVRRFRGTTTDPGKYTISGQRFSDELSKWNWVSVLGWVCLLSEAAFVMNVGMKVTYVFFSELNDQLAPVDLGLVIVLVYVIGLIMFLLPPVPGSAVYLFAGIVLGRKGQVDDAIGFEGGAGIAIIVGIVTKLCACVGQYLVGFLAGQSIKVQQLIGVDKVFTRAIETILSRKGLAPGKVAILVGGPDWPTSVTCGVLKLNIPQMLLGTLPVSIVSVAPQTLMGAMLTKETNGESGIWTMIAAIATGVSVIGQVGAMLTATYFTTKLIETSHEELAKDRPEHAAVQLLTHKEKFFVDKYQEVTNPWSNFGSTKPTIARLIKFSVVLHLLAFFLFGADFVLTDKVCFRKFAITDQIGANYENGGLQNNVLNLVLEPLGYGAIGLFFIASVTHLCWSKALSSYARSKMGESIHV
jgi:hypothetical protein